MAEPDTSVSKRTTTIRIAIVTGAIAVVPAAEAGSAGAAMGVSVTVKSSCTIDTTALAFANYDPVTGAASDGEAAVAVKCSRGAMTSITLGQGVNAAAGSTDLVPARRMKNGSSPETLSYALYQDPARTVAWGNTAATGATYVPASREETTIPVFGRIAGHQDVNDGEYTDVVVATIQF